MERVRISLEEMWDLIKIYEGQRLVFEEFYKGRVTYTGQVGENSYLTVCIGEQSYESAYYTIIKKDSSWEVSNEILEFEEDYVEVYFKLLDKIYESY